MDEVWAHSSTVEHLSYTQRVLGSNPSAPTWAISSMVECVVDIDEVAGPIPALPTNFMGKQIKLEPDSSIPLNIVYEDKDVVVLNKQAGISIHPSINEPNKTLVNALIAKYPELIGVGDDPIRPGIVHRLDKDTSGVLVVAKNQETFEFLKKEWQEGKVIKKYFALVWGHPKEKGEIVSELTRSLKDFRKRMVVRPNKKSEKNIQGKLAITEYKVVKKFRDFSLVEVYPKTGRTHQIRVHLASLGHPVAGDKIYGKNKKKPEGLTRQFLHAFYLKFSLPADLPAQAGRSLVFETDLPDDLSSVLTELPK